MTIECPHAKSDMTPCYRKEGEFVVALSHGTEICVGCGRPIFKIKAEIAREPTNG